MQIEKINNGIEKIEKVTFRLCDKLIDKADKYYISFRILNRCGFFVQSVNSLVFSFETFFKLLYLLDKEEYTINELKKLSHYNKKIAKKIRLDKEKFKCTWHIINKYDLEGIRYNDSHVTNVLNHLKINGKPFLETINLEILELHRTITEKIREKFKHPNYDAYSLYNNWKFSEKKEIKEIIEECLSKGNEKLDSSDT